MLGCEPGGCYHGRLCRCGNHIVKSRRRIPAGPYDKSQEQVSMASLDLQCVSVFSIVGECVLRDEHWQAFGYPKRPRRGKCFNVFVDATKLGQEKVLVREFWAAALGRVFYWTLRSKEFRHRVCFIARLLNLCIDGVDKTPLWPTFEFRSPEDALDFLQRACRDYGSCEEHSEFSEVFAQRCISHLNQRLPSEWIFGAAWLFNSCDSLFMAIIPALNETVAQNPNSDINIAGSKYHEVAQELFRQLESA